MNKYHKLYGYYNILFRYKKKRKAINVNYEKN